MVMTTGSKQAISAEMNVTPMIDVLLVLLVIFMLLIPLDKGEIAQIPQPSNQSLQPPDATIVIQVIQTGYGPAPSLKINKTDVTWDKLGPALKEIFAHHFDKTAFVKGDDNIDFQYVAEVIDIAHISGAERIGLLGGKQ